MSTLGIAYPLMHLSTSYATDPHAGCCRGRETLEAAAEIAVREVQHRLQYPHLYRGHGNSLREGLWRNS